MSRGTYARWRPISILGAAWLDTERRLKVALTVVPARSVNLHTVLPRHLPPDQPVKVDPAYLPAKVLAAVEQRLRERFSFDARAFGQPATLSEAIAAMHSVGGVVAVDVNAFHRGEAAALKPRVEARGARREQSRVLGAELLTLDPRPLGIEVMR